MSSALRFSVIIPLEFHRGQAVRCVRGWAEGQLFPREQFEILIASPAGHPTAELDEVRGLLGPQDRVLEFDRHHDMDLCAKAAESASGEVLFFTESHCLPEPETLASADVVTRRTRTGRDSAAARSRSPATSFRRSRRSGTGGTSSSA